MNRQQKDRLSQFVGITGADSSLATRCLEASGWSVESAIEIYYSNSMHTRTGRAAGPRLDRCTLAGVDGQAVVVLHRAASRDELVAQARLGWMAGG